MVFWADLGQRQLKDTCAQAPAPVGLQSHPAGSPTATPCPGNNLALCLPLLIKAELKNHSKDWRGTLESSPGPWQGTGLSSLHGCGRRPHFELPGADGGDGHGAAEPLPALLHPPKDTSAPLQAPLHLCCFPSQPCPRRG